MNILINQKPPKKRLIILVSILFVLLIAIIAGIFYGRYKAKDSEDGLSFRNIFVKPTKKVEDSLNGLRVNEDKANKTPIAIIVENHPEARPHSGINQASLVYEAIAEGGITRFLALYGPNEPEKVGPVRSARTFYVDLAQEYKAPLAHVGGNIDALDLIKQISARDLDQFRYGLRAYHREPKDGVAVEHTMFANLLKLREIVKERDWDEPAQFTKLSFKEDAAASDRGSSQKITIDFSVPTYQAIWTYQPESNDYVRDIGGVTYTAKNIIIQDVVRQAVTSANGVNRFEFTLTGKGKAKLIQDGKVIEATWKKSSRNDRTKYFEASDKEITFNRGITWYEIVHPELTVKIE